MSKQNLITTQGHNQIIKQFQILVTMINQKLEKKMLTKASWNLPHLLQSKNKFNLSRIRPRFQICTASSNLKKYQISIGHNFKSNSGEKTLKISIHIWRNFSVTQNFQLLALALLELMATTIFYIGELSLTRPMHFYSRNTLNTLKNLHLWIKFISAPVVTLICNL